MNELIENLNLKVSNLYDLIIEINNKMYKLECRLEKVESELDSNK